MLSERSSKPRSLNSSLPGLILPVQSYLLPVCMSVCLCMCACMHACVSVPRAGEPGPVVRGLAPVQVHDPSLIWLCQNGDLSIGWDCVASVLTFVTTCRESAWKWVWHKGNWGLVKLPETSGSCEPVGGFWLVILAIKMFKVGRVDCPLTLLLMIRKAGLTKMLSHRQIPNKCM